MSRHDPRAYGAAAGASFDALYPATADGLETDATVARIAQLAAGGPVLELGVGTGRVALALLERGVEVAGIEASEEMIRRLRAKPRGGEVRVVQGDFVTTRVPGEFAVAFIPLNTIFAPGSREEQMACFCNAAAHLRPGGAFVVEAYVLQPDQLGGEWSIWPRAVRSDHVELQLARYDLPSHRVERTLVHLRPEGIDLIPVVDTYAWPGELDLLAHGAGLRLQTRHGGWDGRPFQATSRKHVSVYRLTDGPSA